MGRFFTRDRFGRPQFLAGLLLLTFLAQCLWLVGHSLRYSDTAEVFRVDEGLRQWRGVGIAGTPLKRETTEVSSTYLPLVGFDQNGGYDPNHSPMWYLIASAPLVVWPEQSQPDLSPYWVWVVRIPYLAFGVLLGASLWYVARRLYGNAGGYVALVLYCFSPAILRSSSEFLAKPEIGAAWGAFGAVFTAIAVAHTLYAPREVVLWNWRRILLLGLSIGLAVGSQYCLLLIVPIALALMLYVAPTRRAAAVTIWGVACAVALSLLLATYAFQPAALWAGFGHADLLGISPRSFVMGDAYKFVLRTLVDGCPALVIALPVALATIVLWRRPCYFGNFAPLLMAVLFLLLAVIGNRYSRQTFAFVALPFLFVFVSGVTADLLETAYSSLVAASTWALLTAYAVWNLVALARISAARPL
jgi:hypothetical protein